MPQMSFYAEEEENKIIEERAKREGISKIDALKRIIREAKKK